MVSWFSSIFQIPFDPNLFMLCWILYMLPTLEDIEIIKFVVDLVILLPWIVLKYFCVKIYFGTKYFETYLNFKWSWVYNFPFKWNQFHLKGKFSVQEEKICTKVKHEKVFCFSNSKAKYIYLVLASVRALLDCDDYYNYDSRDWLSIFGLNNVNSFLNFIFHVNSDKISDLLCWTSNSMVFLVYLEVNPKSHGVNSVTH